MYDYKRLFYTQVNNFGNVLIRFSRKLQRTSLLLYILKNTLYIKKCFIF